jgi:hypothetical protein
MTAILSARSRSIPGSLSSQHVGDVAWQLPDQPRRPPVGAHPERACTLDIEELGHLVELDGNLGVDDGFGKLCALPSIGEAAPVPMLSP